MDPKLRNEMSDSFSEIIDDQNDTTAPLKTDETAHTIDVSKCLATKQLLRNAMQNLPKLNIDKRSDEHMIVLGSKSSNRSLFDKLNKCVTNSMNTSADSNDGKCGQTHKWTQLKTSMTQRIETQIEQKWKQREIIEKIENEELDDLDDEEIEEDIDEEIEEDIDEDIDEEIEEDVAEEVDEENGEPVDENIDDGSEEKNDEQIDDKNKYDEIAHNETN